MRWLLALVAGLCLLAPAVADAGVQAPPDGLVTSERERAIAPGLRLSTFETFEKTGWTRAHLLTADLSEPALRSDLLGGTVSGARPLSAHAEAAGAVAGINGDFFNINETNAAVGPEIGGGVLRKAVTPAAPVVGVGTDRVARLADLALEGTLAVGGRERPLDALNSAVPAGGVGAFTPLWGPGRRIFAASGTPVTEVVVSEGKVQTVRSSISEDAVPANGLILVARGAAAPWLAQAQPGEPVDLRYAPRVAPPSDFAFALSGRNTLVRGGQVVPQGDATLRPRTAMGWRDGGRTLLLLVVDAPPGFPGSTWGQVADLMDRAGAEDAVMLDGGGSTEMVARVPGDSRASVTNTPTDGSERAVPNGVGLIPSPGSGRLTAFDVRPGETRVFPGLTRDFEAKGHDETFAPVETDPAGVDWDAVPGRLGRFQGSTLRARKAGSGSARAGLAGEEEAEDEEEALGSARLTVLDDLAGLAFDTAQVSLDPGDVKVVRLIGKDAEGFSAAVEPRDAELDYDRRVVAVTETENGALRIEGLPEADGRGTVLKARVAGAEVGLAVTVGLRNERLSSFETASEWGSLAVGGTARVSLTAADDRPGSAAGNQGLALDYDFTGRPGTSAAYAVHREGGVNAPVTLPAGTQRLAMWVKGDGRKHWLRALMASGKSNVPFDFAREVDWTGWRRVEGRIPAQFVGTTIKLSRVYLVETSAQRKDAGGIVLDDLDARVGQTLDVANPPREDPYVLQQRGVGANRWRFAVISDTHTTASAGRDSFSGRQTIKALQQIAAAQPDFVLVSGDGVDTGRPEDFAFFESLIDEQLGDVPVHWVPGNHESAGGSLAAFEAATGRPARESFDHRGTRFITLNSSLGSLRVSDFAQLVELRRRLEAAEEDPAVKSVVLVDHHPPSDPSGGGASQLSDPLEAGLLRRWLAEFRERAGKHVAFFSGHAHTAAVSRSDGLLEINAPSVGKQPYGSADRGGFFGWQLVGADPTPARLSAGKPDPDSLDWLEAEVRPVIDGAELSAPETLPVGESAAVSATGITSEYGLRFPLRYPASTRWSGGEGLAVVRGERMASEAARFRRTIAVLDLETMRLTGVRDGSIRLEVASGDQTVGMDVRVAESASSARPGRERSGRRAEPGARAEALENDVVDHH